MHRIVAAGHMAQPHGGVEYSGVSGPRPQQLLAEQSVFSGLVAQQVALPS